MSSLNCIEKSASVRQILEKAAERLSYETGFVQRQSKLNGQVFAQMFVLGTLANPAATLNDLVQDAASLGVDISEAGLQQRLTDKAVRFLEALLQESLREWSHAQGLDKAMLQGFSQVNLLDSTLVQLPGRLAAVFPGFGPGAHQSAMLKVQLSFDYLHGHLNALEVVAGNSPDQNCKLHEVYGQADSLTLFDLGYFKKSVFQTLHQQGAYFISRLSSQVELFESPSHERAFALLAALRTDTVQPQLFDLYLGETQRVPVRLIALPVPAQVAEERRRKAHQKAKRDHRNLSQHHQDWLAWNIYITNVTAEHLTVAQLLQLYRLRWQIELIFKLWKSYARLDHVRQWGVARLLCQFYARLLGLVLFHWLSAPFRDHDLGELAFPKAFRILQRHAHRLLQVIAAPSPHLDTQLDLLTRDFLRFALKESRKKSPSTLSLL